MKKKSGNSRNNSDLEPDTFSMEHDSAQLRVLILNSARKWIGEAAHCLSLAEGLRQAGVSVMLAARQGFALEEAAVKHGIPCTPFHFLGNFTGYHDLRDIIRLRRLILDENINILHCHRGKDHWIAAVTRMTVPFARRPALLRTRHVVMPVKNHFMNRWLYSGGTDGLIAVSRAAADSYGSLPVPRPPAIIHASVDSIRFCPERRSDTLRRELGIPVENQDGILIGLVGRLQRIKGQDVFIQAMPRILQSFPQARFVIAGMGLEDKRDYLRNLAARQGVADRVVFLDYVEHIEALVASFDIGVVASRGSEGSSRIVMEYMASGVPVVSTDAGGIPELLENGRLGRMIPPGDPDLLAGAILKALSDPEDTARISGAALIKARTYLSPSRFVAETVREYRQALDRVCNEHQ